MARWKLTSPHYLVVDGIEWEYKEIDRTTGKEVRRRFQVPRLVDPADPVDWTQKEYGLNGIVVDGVVNVSDGNNPGPGDIIFHGDPTPDMVPLDDEARVISDSFAKRWNHPIESLSGTYADGLINQFQVEMAKLQSTNKPAQIEGMSELLTAMSEMMKQNQTLIDGLGKRRV